MRDDTPADWLVYLYLGALAFIVLSFMWTMVPLWWDDWF